MNRVREYREKLELTRQQLASKIDITSTTLYYVENGRTPSLRIAFKLANFFGVSVEELFPQFKDNTERKTPAGV